MERSENHCFMLFNVPLGAGKAARLIELLELTPDARVLDAGCGTGEFLIRTIEATGAFGVGFDLDAKSIEAANRNVGARIPGDRHEFKVVDLRKEGIPDETFDAAICLGSTHAFGDGGRAYPSTLEGLKRAVRPGGRVLVGDGYWKQPPAAEYLELLGDPPGIYHDHRANVSVAEAMGLVPLYAAVSNDDEWDDFEWSHRMRFEREAALHPDDPKAAAKLDASRAWRDGYLRWGRSTMGFGFYLFMKPQVAK